MNKDNNRESDADYEAEDQGEAEPVAFVLTKDFLLSFYFFAILLIISIIVYM